MANTLKKLLIIKAELERRKKTKAHPAKKTKAHPTEQKAVKEEKPVTQD